MEEKPVVEWYKVTKVPNHGVLRSGYSVKSGAPTAYMVKLKGTNVWRRLMCIQRSNAGSLFVVVNGKQVFLSDTCLTDGGKAANEKA